MPWDEKDYPDSMKNLDSLTKRKAIDIANAMVEEGYKEENAIPIAISQAEDWIKDASEDEKEELKEKDIKDHEDKPENKSARLQDKDVNVVYDHDKEEWEVITEGAKKADSRHKTKKEAEERAREIADNKDVKVKSYKKSDSK